MEPEYSVSVVETMSMIITSKGKKKDKIFFPIISKQLERKPYEIPLVVPGTDNCSLSSKDLITV